MRMAPHVDIHTLTRALWQFRNSSCFVKMTEQKLRVIILGSPERCCQFLRSIKIDVGWFSAHVDTLPAPKGPLRALQDLPNPRLPFVSPKTSRLQDLGSILVFLSVLVSAAHGSPGSDRCLRQIDRLVAVSLGNLARSLECFG